MISGPCFSLPGFGEVVEQPKMVVSLKRGREEEMCYLSPIVQRWLEVGNERTQWGSYGQKAN